MKRLTKKILESYFGTIQQILQSGNNTGFFDEF